MLQLNGRIAVVFGLANKRSIAWAIAQKLHESGCKLIIGYQNDRMKQEAEGLLAELPGAEALQCDVSNDAEIASVFEDLKQRHGKLHILVHSVAFAPADEPEERFSSDHARRIRIAHDVSVYSSDRFIACGCAADDGRRQHHDHDLLWRGKSRAALQSDGRGEGGAGGDGSLPCGATWASRIFA